MASNKKGNRKKSTAVLIDAEFRIKVEKIIQDFCGGPEFCYEFPNSLTNIERAFVHNLAPKYNLKTRSSGKGKLDNLYHFRNLRKKIYLVLDEHRRLSLFKLTENDEFLNRRVKIKMDPSTVDLLRQYKNEFPLVPRPDEGRQTARKNHKPIALAKPPTVPPRSRADNRIQERRKTLPIFSYRDRILECIDKNRIVLIQGSTGSGKTTQIPQFILETATERGEPCRILCTQPRRISAIASADRVCYERSETSGTTIGYQIRLESSIAPDTNCIFLTPGVFLRYLMCESPEKIFKNITHILIDEAHERAKENDFLLTSIKEHFNANPNLRLVIMSATMDTEVFANYFGGCEEISISLKQFEVQEIYLEDILKQLKFSNQRVEELNKNYSQGTIGPASQSAYVNQQNARDDLDKETFAYINETLDNLSKCENPDGEFQQFIYLVQAENVPVDVRHQETKMTALMVAVGRGCLAVTETLIRLNANPNLRVVFGDEEMNCLDIANKLHGDGSNMSKLLQRHMQVNKTSVATSSDIYDKTLLNIYYDTVLTKFNQFVVDEGIDHELIAQLAEKIHNETPRDGAILIFLPGYDDIIQLSNLVTDRLRNNDFSLFLLHSSMKTEDQKNVFKPVMQRKRKIILSTNIAESSLTIDDVVSFDIKIVLFCNRSSSLLFLRFM